MRPFAATSPCILPEQLYAASARVGTAAGSTQHMTHEGHCRYITPGLPENGLLCGRGSMCCAHTILPSRDAMSTMERRSFHQIGMGRRARNSAWVTGHSEEQRAQQHKAFLCLKSVPGKGIAEGEISNCKARLPSCGNKALSYGCGWETAAREG